MDSDLERYDAADLDFLNERIVQWAKDRQIIQNSTPQAQFLKLVEEVGELASAIAKNDRAAFVDAVGDVFVTLVTTAETGGVSVPQCVSHAYNVIKDRKGHLTPWGVFVKEEQA